MAAAAALFVPRDPPHPRPQAGVSQQCRCLPAVWLRVRLIAGRVRLAAMPPPNRRRRHCSPR
eukprot:1484374-Prymnesium_polylepis.1